VAKSCIGEVVPPLNTPIDDLSGKFGREAERSVQARAASGASTATGGEAVVHVLRYGSNGTSRSIFPVRWAIR
jgi:hypothetical protein